MGAGNWGAGLIPAGNDIGLTTELVAGLLSAEKFNPRTRTVIVNEDGSIASVHYIDQEVALALGVELRSIPSAPDVGLDFQRIRKATDSAAQQTIQDEVNRAVARLLRIHAIVLGVIQFKFSPGRRSFRVPYKNLVAPAPQGRVAEVP